MKYSKVELSCEWPNGECVPLVSLGEQAQYAGIGLEMLPDGTVIHHWHCLVKWLDHAGAEQSEVVPCAWIKMKDIEPEEME